MKKALVYILLSVFMLAMLLPFSVLAEEGKTIRVGWFLSPGYMEKSSDGVYSGYNFEYLNEISKYTGWKYQFVDGNFNDLMILLKKGEIDLLGNVFYNKNREQEFLFPDYSSGREYMSLYVLNESLITENDHNSFNNIKIGVLSDVHKQKVEQYAISKEFKCSITLYDDTEKINKALKENEIDAVACASYQQDDYTRSVARFSPSLLYFITNSGNTEIINDLNNSLSQILIQNPYYNNDLSKKYINTNKTKFYMTSAEKEFVKTLGPISVSYNTNWEPFERQNHSGAFEGVIAEIYKKIAELTGLQFNYIPNTVMPADDADIIACFEQKFHSAQQRNFSLTENFITIPMALICKKGDTQTDNKLALASMTYSSNEIDKMGYEIIRYTDLEQSLEAVKNGEVGQALVNTYSAEYYLAKSENEGLGRVTIQNRWLSLCSAINNDLDPRVYSIINKAIIYLSYSQINDIVISSVFNETKINLNKIIEKMPTDVIIISSIILICAIVFLTVSLILKIKSSSKIKKLLYYDSLTGVLTRYSFEKKAASLIKNSDKNWFILDFDVCRFNQFNALFGKKAGDEFLFKVAKKIEKNLTENELCARLYADHFICLKRCESLEKLITEIKECGNIYINYPDKMVITFKFGIYQITDKKIEISKMIDFTCVAKNMIKYKSEEVYCIYDEDLNRRYLEDGEMLTSFENAIINEEFNIEYQPKYDAFTNEIVGSEALVRWEKPGAESIPPSRFISILENSGKIRELDLFVLKTVCRYQKTLIDEGMTCVPISINFSGLHFYNPNFAQNICNIVAEYNIDRNLIEIEFTETVMIKHIQVAKDAFKNLRKLGFKIAIDDFGSGYSSLNSLKDIPIDILKLDREFFNEGENGDKAELIVKYIIELANNMNLITIAEGIETKEQLDFVKNCGCKVIQGYYFSKSVHGDEFKLMLKNK